MASKHGDQPPWKALLQNDYDALPANVLDLLNGHILYTLILSIIGKKLAHYWCINNKRVLFHGVVLRQMAQKKYKVEYWLDGHPRSESNKELISFHHLVVDFLLDDLVLS